MASGGLVGVKQADDGLALEPAIAWLVEPSPETQIWAPLERDHALESARAEPEPPPAQPLARRQVREFGSRRRLRGALREFYRRYARGALFDGAMQIVGRGQAALVDGAEPVARAPQPDAPRAVRWSEIGLWAFARVGEHGAIGWLGETLNGLRRLGVFASPAAAFGGPPDWFVYVPDARRGELDQHVVVARDGWSFFRALAQSPTPFFLRDDFAAPGRLADLARAPSASPQRS